jgi:predicted hydrocarbon binding protein
MTIEKCIEFEIDHHFDPGSSRHYMNGSCTVLHCHHYATLYTQLADDAKDFEGEKLLKEAAEDTFYEVLNDYFNKRNMTTLEERISIAEQYWKAVGMGLIRFTGIGKYAATAEMEYSHIDEGWLKKWGSRNKPVNFITAGFVAAAIALANNKPPRSFVVKEIQSLLQGDDKSAFEAILR